MPSARRRPPSTSPTLDDGTTAAGAMLGTPGYMAPEQLRGDDVGAGGRRLRARRDPVRDPRRRAAASARRGALASTLERRSDVAGRAARPTARSRPSSTRVVHRRARRAIRPRARPRASSPTASSATSTAIAIVARRRALAAEHLAAARAALATDDEPRATRCARAGRALALDPGMAEAAELVAALMLEPAASCRPRSRPRSRRSSARC